ncbi:MAG TPA: Sir2 family NAD-dependent protein deacetylase [Verrucomicrobiae bacterium]|nr:Sir2 family NAD-dependent protein deacetylase [Verrucomicrobiae bacterium]
MAPSLELARRWINDAEALLITAGAGMGVDSGLPDFRSADGFWRAYPPLARLRLSFFEMANPQWFDRDPALAWAFYGHRLNLYRRTTPHPGFAQLLRTASRKPGGYFVFTSNVDGQFQKAGFAPERIVECHGSIHHFQCCRACTDEIRDAAGETVSIDEARFCCRPPLPSCPRCGGMARPNILMFGDDAWVSRRTDLQHDRFSDWLDPLRATRLTIIEVGAGTAVPGVRILGEQLSARFRFPLIRINPEDATVRSGNLGLALGAADAIARICPPDPV